MKRNKVTWGVVALVVLATIVISARLSNRPSQAMSGIGAYPTPPETRKTPDYSRYSQVDFDAAPDSLTASQLEERSIKNKRYDLKATIMANPPFDAESVIAYDVEPYPDAIPASRLVIVGRVSDAKALLSNEKKGVYTEYSVIIDKVLKADEERPVKPGNVVVVDRPGGVVRYPTGQKVLYVVDGQTLLAGNGRYVFFLDTDDPRNPNYKIVNGYSLNEGKVMALDNTKSHSAFNGKPEVDFLQLIAEKMKQGGTSREQ